MRVTRRQAVSGGLAGAALAVLPIRLHAGVDEAIAAFTGGTTASMGDLSLTAPEIAENGGSVTVGLSCPGAEAIRLIAPANPNPEVCTLHFGPLTGAHDATIRIRMADSQELVALARMPDGSFRKATAQVFVTVGACVG